MVSKTHSKASNRLQQVIANRKNKSLRLPLSQSSGFLFIFVAKLIVLLLKMVFSKKNHRENGDL